MKTTIRVASLLTLALLLSGCVQLASAVISMTPDSLWKPASNTASNDPPKYIIKPSE